MKKIEAAERSAIAAIFEERGEPEFRRIESEMLRQHVRSIERGNAAVIAMGGGAFAQSQNRELALQHGIVFCGWIALFDTVQLRVALTSHRPLARDPERFAALYRARREIYALADVRIAIDYDDPAIAVEAIARPPDSAMSASTLRRRHARSIFNAGLAAADPSRAVEAYSAPHLISSAFGQHLPVEGAGKAEASMAKAAERVLRAAYRRRIRKRQGRPRDEVAQYPARTETNAAIPNPMRCGMAGAERIAQIAASAGRGDLVICLISGGASAADAAAR